MENSEAEYANNESFKQLIYELMIGLYDLNQVRSQESKFIENEFAEGKKCDELYSQIFDAKCRICERLNVDEDSDIEMIIESMNEIAHILSLKMYDYGAIFGR